MSAPDFDEFAALWKQEPNAEEERIFQSLARTVSRRAKLIYHIELGLAVFLVIGVFAAFYLKQAPGVWIVGILVLAAVGWSSWKRYELHQVAMIVDCSDRQSLLSSAIASARARLRQSTLSLILVPPCFLLGLAMRATMKGNLQEFATALWGIFTQPVVLIGATAVFLLLLYIGQQNVRLRRELQRLRTLQGQYRAEADLDAGFRDGSPKP